MRYNAKMSPIQILAHLRKQPFRPIRMCMSDGSTYDVLHPENAAVSRTEVAVAVAEADEEVPERMVYCEPLHITRIVPLDGSRSKRPSRKRGKQ